MKKLSIVRVSELGRLAIVLALLSPLGCESGEWRERTVVATAYNAMPEQTTRKHPNLAAWGDRLRPGMKAIAVSRDLLAKGLAHGAKVKIEGLPGTWIVRDKMAGRWRNKIDIYMGNDEARALEWGRRQVTIRWWVPDQRDAD